MKDTEAAYQTTTANTLHELETMINSATLVNNEYKLLLKKLNEMRDPTVKADVPAEADESTE